MKQLVSVVCKEEKTLFPRHIHEHDKNKLKIKLRLEELSRIEEKWTRDVSLSVFKMQLLWLAAGNVNTTVTKMTVAVVPYCSALCSLSIILLIATCLINRYCAFLMLLLLKWNKFYHCCAFRLRTIYIISVFIRALSPCKAMGNQQVVPLPSHTSLSSRWEPH